MKKTIKTLSKLTLLVTMSLTAGVQALTVGGRGEWDERFQVSEAPAGGAHAARQGAVPGVSRPSDPVMAGAVFGNGDGDSSFSDVLAWRHGANVAGGAATTVAQGPTGPIDHAGTTCRNDVDDGHCGDGTRPDAAATGAPDLLAGLAAPAAGRPTLTAGSFEALQAFQGLGEHVDLRPLALEAGSNNARGFGGFSGDGRHAASMPYPGEPAAGAAHDGDAGLPLPVEMVTASGGGQVSPVPEPQTYALMLAGLAAVAVACRRRKRCAAGR